LLAILTNKDNEIEEKREERRREMGRWRKVFNSLFRIPPLVASFLLAILTNRGFLVHWPHVNQSVNTEQELVGMAAFHRISFVICFFFYLFEFTPPPPRYWRFFDHDGLIHLTIGTFCITGD
jgi:hypothetical protein